MTTTESSPWLLLGLVFAALALALAWWLRRRHHAKTHRAPEASGSAVPELTQGSGAGRPGVPPSEARQAQILPPEEPRRGAPWILVGRDLTRHPLVFAHGWMGTDRYGLPRFGREYFRGVRRHLRSQGFEVHFVRLSPTASIERRAQQLGEQIERVGCPVNIVAHSMGGLDARYAISRLGLDACVASLTTVGTPHQGTPIADATVTMLGSMPLVRRALDTAGWNIDGLYDLTTERMRSFNEAVRDAGQIEYHSYVGRVTPAAVHTLLSPGFSYLRRAVGDNDGLVPSDSQRWGSVAGEIDADHWAQIGWSGPFDARSFYLYLALTLARRGL
jgi:triacylglycerol lipase